MGQSTQKQRGQFFTPRSVAAQLLRLASSDLGEGWPAGEGAPSVLDPACGDGAFLGAALEAGWARDASALTGLDLDPGVLAGPEGARLESRDALRSLSQLQGAFDLAVGNPPFGGRGVRDLPRRALEHLGRDFETWRVEPGGLPHRVGPGFDRLLRFPVATLFLELFVRAVRPGGVAGLVLPASFFANRRDAPVRSWLLRQARIVSVTELPADAFAGTGTRARTTFLVVKRRSRALGSGQDAVAVDGPVVVRRLGAGGFELPLALGDLQGSGRWDPGYHDPAWVDLTERCRLPCRPLGDFVETLCYGAIRVGERPRQVDRDGALYVTQRAVRDWGVDPDACLRIAKESPFDGPRFRLQPGDLVVPRCGQGTLGQNRMTRFDGPAGQPAVVDCFTDRLGLRGISTAWVLGTLRSELGWSQIRRTFNGVGTPNLSYGEIRGIQVPVPDAETEGQAEQLWAAIAARDEEFEALRHLVRSAAFDR